MKEKVKWEISPVDVGFLLMLTAGMSPLILSWKIFVHFTLNSVLYFSVRLFDACPKFYTCSDNDASSSLSCMHTNFTIFSWILRSFRVSKRLLKTSLILMWIFFFVFLSNHHACLHNLISRRTLRFRGQMFIALLFN
jgi:hypothetical protein